VGQLRQPKRVLGYVVLVAGVLAFVSMLIVAVAGDDKPPYNDPAIAVIAWVSMVVAGAAFLVLFLIWILLGVVEVVRRAR
jgi:nicotinamide riboside transporter PnuC